MKRKEIIVIISSRDADKYICFANIQGYSGYVDLC